MRPYLFIPFVLAWTALSAQSGTVELTVRTENCNQPLRLFSFSGFTFDVVGKLNQHEGGRYTISQPLEEDVIYYLGPEPRDARPLVLRAGESPTVTASCGQFARATIADSPVNAAYGNMRATLDEHYRRYATLRDDIEVIQDERVNREGRIAMQKLDREKRDWVTGLSETEPILGRIAALNTYLSYYSADTSRYSGALDHYLDTYFQLVDFSDPGYDHLSPTFEAGSSFTRNILEALPADRLAAVILEQTGRWPAGSRARFLARGGAFSQLQANRNPAALPVGDALVAEFGEQFARPAALIARRTAQLRTELPGQPAPDIKGPTPTGDSLSLSDLRGQIVLIDFWASWCGPCRRENPNVVRMYDKYKDRGFEILGVSLDDDRNRWLKAIEDDGLVWPHISDLKGWRSAYARRYGVTSIPQTVLVDREGNILARNLRGPDLERKLEEVLGVN
jgi:peroxiredoxin